MITHNQVASFYLDLGIMGNQYVLVIYDWIDGEEAKGLDEFDLPIIRNIVFRKDRKKIYDITEMVTDKSKAAIRAVIRDKAH